MDLRKYYADRRELTSQLQGQFPGDSCQVISVLNRDRNSTPGSASEVNLENAARLIVDGTHRLANDEEREAFKAQQAIELDRATLATTTAQRNRFNRLLSGGTL